MNNQFNSITNKFLKELSEMNDTFEASSAEESKPLFKGAYNIRENGQCISRYSSENIIIESKKDKPGLVVTVKPGTKGESVYIPACVTKGGMTDLVYNDIFIGAGADIKIISGCGVHTEDEGEAMHNGIHHLVIGENAKVIYEEKHMGTGKGKGIRSINPVMQAELEKNSYLEINATQISGVDKAHRKTNIKVAEGAKLIVRERLFTEAEQETKTFLNVELNGNGSSADLVSRSVARDKSYQTTDILIVGNAACTGHAECDAIIDDEAIVDASPRLFAHNKEASLIHEAAIGKIAGEQILKLRTLGLTEEEAEKEIIQGFLA